MYYITDRIGLQAKNQVLVSLRKRKENLARLFSITMNVGDLPSTDNTMRTMPPAFVLPAPAIQFED